LAAVATGRELVERCQDLNPDLVITDIKMPDLDGIEAAIQICRCRPVPVVVVSAYHDPTLIEQAAADHILGYLVKPIKPSDLEPVIALTMRRFEQLQPLQQEAAAGFQTAADMFQALEKRKVIAPARSALMRRKQLDRTAAHRRLQQLAGAQGKSPEEWAETLLTQDDSGQPRPTD
jgi:response regulator NasT